MSIVKSILTHQSQNTLRFRLPLRSKRSSIVIFPKYLSHPGNAVQPPEAVPDASQALSWTFASAHARTGSHLACVEGRTSLVTKRIDGLIMIVEEDDQLMDRLSAGSTIVQNIAAWCRCEAHSMRLVSVPSERIYLVSRQNFPL